ncbi:MAG: YigZ family protein [Clostridia bacterium]|nr:YigZ family protein [Clostridia bacterium]
MEEFITIKNSSTSEIIEKKSKFIANIFYIENVEEAEEKIKQIKKIYHDAKHNCIAYRVIENERLIEKSSDDGEPSGTAGAPMLSILQKNNLCNIVVIVTRYFGGILLGTGGLVSCYSSVTIDAISNAEKIIKCQGIELDVELEYNNLEIFKYYCKNEDIEIIDIKYLDKIICKIQIEFSKRTKMLQDIEEKRINIIRISMFDKKYINRCIRK